MRTRGLEPFLVATLLVVGCADGGETTDGGGGSGGMTTSPVCGDGTVNGGEECDDGGESATCNADCTDASCGDGVTNAAAGEQCDDAGASATCNADCTSASCGDGEVNAAGGEICDEGGDTATCDGDCTAPLCGDSYANTAAGEDCDDGADSATCNADCTSVACGDDYVNSAAGEECEEGAVDTATCDDDCTIPECGDGHLNTLVNEDCDEGGDAATCDGDCTPVLCGDSYANPAANEECDQGGSDTASCDGDCTTPVCGDNWHNAAAGEQCDDGNLVSGDGCDDQCQLELRPNVMLCGSSQRDISMYFPAGYNPTLSSNCTPNNTVQAIFISRTGIGAYNAGVLAAYVDAGGLVFSEFSSSDEIFSDLFSAVTQGTFTGGCYDRLPTTVQFNPGDQFWIDNSYAADPDGSSGCGYPITAFPGITPLSGWSANQVSLAYRDRGLGRFWITEFDWQDYSVSYPQPQTIALMGYMLTTRP